MTWHKTITNINPEAFEHKNTCPECGSNVHQNYKEHIYVCNNKCGGFFSIERPLKIYQFTLEGYVGDGSTDHLIKWVAAGSQKIAEAVMTIFEFKWIEANEIEDNILWNDSSIDLIVKDDLFRV